MKTLGLIFLVFILGCQTKPKDIPPTAEFIAHDNWLGINLPFEKYDKLRLQLEGLIGRSLKHRGEAHITLVTPPEYEAFKDTLSMNEVQKILQPQKLQSAKFQHLCIGKIQQKSSERTIETFYVVIESPDLFNQRADLERTLAQKGYHQFKAKNYSPHITLGFDEVDIHPKSSTAKDSSTCTFPIQQLHL